MCTGRAATTTDTRARGRAHRVIHRQNLQFPEKDTALREDVHALGGLVGEVLRDQGGDRLLALVEGDRVAAIARREGEPGSALELVARPVSLLGRDGHVDLVAGGLARECPLQPRDDVAFAVQVAERRAAARGLDDVPLLVAQGVMQRYDAILLDVHGRPQQVAGAEW